MNRPTNTSRLPTHISAVPYNVRLFGIRQNLNKLRALQLFVSLHVILNFVLYYIYFHATVFYEYKFY